MELKLSGVLVYGSRMSPLTKHFYLAQPRFKRFAVNQVKSKHLAVSLFQDCKASIKNNFLCPSSPDCLDPEV